MSITYISGGLLGDFIQQLSVIQEMYMTTGKKGILYISDKGDAFRNGLKKTFEDTYEIIMTQPYMEDYMIYPENGEYDIDLSSWRNSKLLYKENWHSIFSSCYTISWGLHPWLSVSKNTMWENVILVNVCWYRPISSFSITDILKKTYGTSKIVFISNDIESYEKIGIPELEWYQPNSFTDMCVAIGSCKLFIGGLSAMLTIAHALHHPRVIGLSSGEDATHNVDFDKIFDNVYYDISEIPELSNNHKISRCRPAKLVIQVSVGEIVDKLSILEIKEAEIRDSNKLVHITYEKEYLLKECSISGIFTYPHSNYFYRLLLYINKKIWDFTNKIKLLSYEMNPNEFACISNEIFMYNQQRFRLKNYFNINAVSTIKEQKSYTESSVFILLNESLPLSTIVCAKIQWLCLQYDVSYMYESANILQIPTLYTIKENETVPETMKKICIDDVPVPDDVFILD